MIKQDTVMFGSYLEVMVNRCFKIIPLFEEDNQYLSRYIHSLIYELYGLQNVIEGLENNARFISLLATLETLYDDSLFDNKDGSDDKPHETIRSEVFKCIDIIKKIKGGLKYDSI